METRPFDTQEIITRLLENKDEPVDEVWLQEMLNEHPAFILPALLALKRNGMTMGAALRQRLQNTVVLNCADPTAVLDFIDPTSAGWAAFYPHIQPKQATTEATIDDFLENYGHAATAEENAVLERLIFNPTPPDYFTDTDTPYDPSDPLALPPELARGTAPEAAGTGESGNESAGSGESAAAATEVPEEKSQESAPASTAAPEQMQETNSPLTPADESPLMESLAKIFIKQRRYERAFEIISKLSLNYPEKSVYFADQLRFLQKLIINQSHKPK